MMQLSKLLLLQLPSATLTIAIAIAITIQLMSASARPMSEDQLHLSSRDITSVSNASEIATRHQRHRHYRHSSHYSSHLQLSHLHKRRSFSPATPSGFQLPLAIASASDSNMNVAQQQQAEVSTLPVDDSANFDDDNNRISYPPVSNSRETNNSNLNNTNFTDYAASISATDSIEQQIGGNLSSSAAAAATTTSTVEQNELEQVLDVGPIQAAQYGLFRHSLSVSVIITIAYTIVFIVGLIGNSFVVAIVCKSPRMRTVTNYFIANLAFADILVLLFCLPATLASNIFTPYVLGLVVCKTVSYLQGVAVSASINTMVAVTLDRFLAICFPMDWHMSRRTARRTIACIWLFSLAISFPWALYFTLVPFHHENKYLLNYCTEVWPYERLGHIYFVCANLILCYLFPATVIILCYLGIWYKIERRNIPGDRPKGLRIELIMQKSKLKVVKMMMVVVVIFLLSWLPTYIIFARIKLAEERSLFEDWLIANLMPLAQWLGASNSCINPILYTFFNSKYKRNFIDLLGFGFCCKPAAGFGAESRRPIGAANGRAATNSHVNTSEWQQNSSVANSRAAKRGTFDCAGGGVRRPTATSSVVVATGATYIRMNNLNKREVQEVGVGGGDKRLAQKHRPSAQSAAAAAAASAAKPSGAYNRSKGRSELPRAVICNAREHHDNEALIGNHLPGRRCSAGRDCSAKTQQQQQQRPRARRWLSVGSRLTAAAKRRKQSAASSTPPSLQSLDRGDHLSCCEIQRGRLSQQIGIRRELFDRLTIAAETATTSSSTAESELHKVLRLTRSTDSKATCTSACNKGLCSGDHHGRRSSCARRSRRKSSFAAVAATASSYAVANPQPQALARIPDGQVDSSSLNDNIECGAEQRYAARGSDKKKMKFKHKKRRTFLVEGCGGQGTGERSLRSNSTRDTVSTDITAISFTNGASQANQDLIRCSGDNNSEVDNNQEDTNCTLSRLPTLTNDDDNDDYDGGGDQSNSEMCSKSSGLLQPLNGSGNSNGDLLYTNGDNFTGNETICDEDYDDADYDDDDDDEEGEEDEEEEGSYYEEEEEDDDEDQDQVEKDSSDGQVDDDEDDGNLLFGSARASSCDSPPAQVSKWNQRPRSSLDRASDFNNNPASSTSVKLDRGNSLIKRLVKQPTASLAQRLGLISAPESADSDKHANNASAAQAVEVSVQLDRATNYTPTAGVSPANADTNRPKLSQQSSSCHLNHAESVA